MKVFKQYFLYLLLIIFLSGSAVYLYLLVYGDDIKMALIDQLNNQIETEIKVEEVDLTFWEQFPRVSVTFSNIRVKESIPGSKEYLAVFERGYFMLDLFEVITGSYGAEKILLENGWFRPSVRKDHTRNFQVFKDTGKTEETESKGEFTFDLKQITFKNTEVVYDHVPKQTYIRVFGEKFTFRGRFQSNQFTLKANGSTLIEELTLDSSRYLTNKPVNFRTRFAVNNEKGLYKLDKGNIQIAGAKFDLSGGIREKENGPYLDLTLKGADNNLQTLLALVPEEYRESFDSYKGKGAFYFDGAIKGNLSSTENPHINFEFGIDDGRIARKGVNEKLEHVNLKGRVTNGSGKGLKTSLLEINEFSADLNNRSVTGSMSLNNWTDPYLNLALNTDVYLQDVQEFLPFQLLERMEGALKLDAKFAGRIRHLKQVETVHKTNFAGSVLLSDAGIFTKTNHPDYRELNGRFRFNGNDLVIDRFQGYAGDSDFSLNGRFSNLASFLFLPDKNLTIEADFDSKYINLKPLLTTESKSKSNDSVVTFALPDYLVLDLNLNCDTIAYDRFFAHQVSGDIDYANETMQLNGVNFKSMEGQVNLGGKFFSDEAGNLKAQLKADCSSINLESLFFQLHNFGQDVLTDRHLKGTVDANIQLNAAWNENLEPQYDQLNVNSQLSITNGELNNFKPVMKMAVLAKVEALKNLKFEELANNVVIRNETIQIPEMAIRSNAFEMDFSGKHHFDNTIDYHIRLNLSEMLFGKKSDYENEFGKVVYDDEGDMNLFVKMVGNADDPKVRFDRKAVTQKIGKDLAREKQEIRKALETGNNGSDDDKEEYELEWDK